ncbi:MAG: EAL domain-containing protein [Mizugakiibacter sp.]|uniref:sensor domain-containing protein n=1 Tax=Mizugakiibacter sp. TaxID=1972610 RepID=UPI0031C0C130|nr:EAL domain-containing protein [Xanthomonadaceae bacterium]
MRHESRSPNPNAITTDAAAVEPPLQLASGMLAALEALRSRSADPPQRRHLDRVIDNVRRLAADADASATRFRILLDAVPDAVTLHDEDGRILDANAAACRDYGYTLDELRRMSVHDLNPGLPHDHMRRMLETFELGHTATDETTNRRRNGDVFPVEVHSSAYRDGNQRRIVAVARDLSGRRNIDAELRTSEARYRLLLQAMDKGVLVQDTSGGIVSVNPAACRILGVSEAEILAMRREDLHDWRFVDEHGDAIDLGQLPGFRAIKLGRNVESSLLGVYLPHLHLYRWLSATAVPQFEAGQSRPFQVISTFSDVTVLKRQADLFDKTQRLAGIGGWELDDLRGLLFWTDELYRIHDLPTGSAVSEARALSFYDEDDRKHLRRALQEARTAARPFDLELRLTTAIGRGRWVRAMGQPLVRHGRIYGVAGTVQDITERKLVEDQLKRQASTDRVTGLPNRETALAQLGRMLTDADSDAGPAVLYVDIDRFKLVNDVLGHVEGDHVLKESAERLLRCAAGAQATVARFGGDEFLLLVCDISDFALLMALAERITATFHRPFQHGGSEFLLTVSIGIARAPTDGDSVQQLVNHAEAAMLEAKRRGRNTWQPFDHELARDLSDRLLMESLLRRALDNGEFRLVYQPKVDLARSSVIGMEALLRWNSPQLGEVSPSHFIPHAENSGEIVRIGAWVIGEACRALRTWREAGLGLRHVAVNVSFRQLLGGSVLDAVQSALRECELPGNALEIEMTERVLIEDAGDIVETFSALRRMGVSLTIDDFGEGYSSLNYLRRLPIDGLKISHTFMQGIPANAVDSSICQAIVQIAQSLGMKLTAEGVETEAQREFLLRLGTPFAQGFLFSPPLEAARVPAFLEAWGEAGG